MRMPLFFKFSNTENACTGKQPPHGGKKNPRNKSYWDMMTKSKKAEKIKTKLASSTTWDPPKTSLCIFRGKWSHCRNQWTSIWCREKGKGGFFSETVTVNCPYCRPKRRVSRTWTRSWNFLDKLFVRIKKGLVSSWGLSQRLKIVSLNSINLKSFFAQFSQHDVKWFSF